MIERIVGQVYQTIALRREASDAPIPQTFWLRGASVCTLVGVVSLLEN